MSVQFKTVDEFAVGQRLDNYLLKHLKGVPKSHIYRVIRKGEVRVNKGRKKADYKLQIDDVVRIPPIRVASGVAFLHVMLNQLLMQIFQHTAFFGNQQEPNVPHQ
jgi:23S rRNA-/tRNA-specific pseudouridylate synthase